METGGVARQRRDVESPAEVPHKMGKGMPMLRGRVRPPP
jgi:hypothetical protein